MIGLIFGETDFPKYIYKKIKNKKKYTIIDLTNKNFFKKDKNSHKVSIGQFGKIISILKENKCNKVLFAGKVQKPNFLKIKLDLKGLYYIPGIIEKSKRGIRFNTIEHLYLCGLGLVVVFSEFLHPIFFVKEINGEKVTTMPFLPLLFMSIYCAIGLIYAWYLSYKQYLSKIKRIMSYAESPC